MRKPQSDYKMESGKAFISLFHETCRLLEEARSLSKRFDDMQRENDEMLRQLDELLVFVQHNGKEGDCANPDNKDECSE